MEILVYGRGDELQAGCHLAGLDDNPVVAALGHLLDIGDAARQQGARFLRDPDARLPASAHLAGTHATLADAAVLPFMRQFAMVEPAWFDAQPWQRLRTWLSDWIASAPFARAMHKYEPWKGGERGIDSPPI